MKINDIMGQLRGFKWRRSEDTLYRIVGEEMERGDMDPVAQARSVQEANGEDGKIKAACIRHRVRRLKDELITEKLASENLIKRNEEAEQNRVNRYFDRHL